MSKIKIFLIVVVTVILSWIFSISLGRVLAAKIYTWPLLSKWKIISPQTPIVVTNYQTVRVSDSGDVLQSANTAKSKISAVVLVSGETSQVVGAAINLTSDGAFVTAASVFAKTDGNYFVVLSDGTQSPVVSKVSDPATSLTFFKAQLNNVPTASLGKSSDLQAGDKAVFITNSIQNFMDKVEASTITSSQADVGGMVLQSDYPSRSFSAQTGFSLIPGEVIVNTNADIVGIWNGSKIISSDVLKQALALYFNNSQKIIRPGFGFGYSVVGQSEGKLAGLSEGALIKSISAGSPAAVAGLALGDVITSINNQNVNESSQLEQFLQNYKPGDVISLNVIRSKKSLNIKLTVGELKNN